MRLRRVKTGLERAENRACMNGYTPFFQRRVGAITVKLQRCSGLAKPVNHIEVELIIIYDYENNVVLLV